MLKFNRTTGLLLALAMVVALAVFAPAQREVVAPTRESGTPAAANSAGAASSDKRVAAAPNVMPEREGLAKSKSDLFATQSWQPPPPKVVAAPPPPPPVPQPPPMTYRFAGRFAQDGKESIFVSKGDTPVAVKPGDMLDGYRVESISPNVIDLVYLPLNHRERIFVPPAIPGEASAVASAGSTVPVVPFVPPNVAAAPSASTSVLPAMIPKPPANVARVQWQGPAQVKFGAPFSVALRVDADQPISGSPMQIRFDPAVLESVGVRPGKRVGAQGQRGFVYTVNRDGSILVSATGLPAENKDPELLVLTFKPKKPGAQAEIKLTNLDLQGPGGRALAHNGLANFRVTVTP